MAAHLPILTFHDIADDGAVISTSPALFERGMACLHDAGFRTLDLTAAAEMIRRGERFPYRHVVITFDDGYESVYRVSFPVLQRYGFTATVFVTVGKQPPAEPNRPAAGAGGEEATRLGADPRAGAFRHPFRSAHPHAPRLDAPVPRMRRARGRGIQEDPGGCPELFRVELCLPVRPLRRPLPRAGPAAFRMRLLRRTRFRDIGQRRLHAGENRRLLPANAAPLRAGCESLPQVVRASPEHSQASATNAARLPLRRSVGPRLLLTGSGAARRERYPVNGECAHSSPDLRANAV